jgi:hypothetical protein
MPLSRSQVENFVAEFFKDHRLAAPAIARRRLFRVTLARRKRLNLPYTITRPALADQVAARLCRDVVIRDARKQGRKGWRYYRHFAEWREYVRGVVLKQFGPGDGLK